MSRTILTDVDGFTPVIDDLARELGVTTALVFGRVWRYCQMELGVCIASQTTIANDLELSRETANRCLKQLVDAGYLNELIAKDGAGNPKTGITKTYQDTGKAGISLQMTAGTCDRRSQPQPKKGEPVIVDHNPVIYDHNPCDLESQPPVIVDHTKIDSLREKVREKVRDSSLKSQSPSDPSNILRILKTSVQPDFDKTGFERKVKPLIWLGWEGDILRLGITNEPNYMFLTVRGKKIFDRNLQAISGNPIAQVEFVLLDKEPA